MGKRFIGDLELDMCYWYA